MKRAPQTLPTVSPQLAAMMSIYDYCIMINPSRFDGLTHAAVSTQLQQFVEVGLDLYDDLTLIEYIMHRREMKKPR